MSERLFIGIDGGGTRSRAVVITENGDIRAEAAGGSMNFYASSMSDARAVLADLLRQLSYQINQPFHSLHIASAALDDRADPDLSQALTAGLADRLKVVLISDILAALYGLTLGEPGVMIVSGTGMMGAALTSTSQLILRGGWGYALGDEGSCFAIGKEAIMAAIRADEQQAPPTQLSQRVCDFFAVNGLREIIPKIYDKGTAQQVIASFSSEVISAARDGDAVAAAIVDSAIDALLTACSSLLEAVRADGKGIRAGVYGGFFNNTDLRDVFSRRLALQYPEAKVMEPKIPPEVGAILYGLREMQVEDWSAITSRVSRRFGQEQLGQEQLGQGDDFL